MKKAISIATLLLILSLPALTQSAGDMSSHPCEKAHPGDQHTEAAHNPKPKPPAKSTVEVILEILEIIWF